MAKLTLVKDETGCYSGCSWQGTKYTICIEGTKMQFDATDLVRKEIEQALKEQDDNVYSERRKFTAEKEAFRKICAIMIPFCTPQA